MAIKKEEKKIEIKKNPTGYKILVEQGRVIGSPKVEHKILHSEIVASKEDAKNREKELKEEYKDIDALSIVSFSL